MPWPLRTRRSSLLSCSGHENATWSQPARPASRDMCGLAASFGSARRRSGHALIGHCEPAGAVYCPAQDKRMPHGHGKRGQPTVTCAGSLLVAARHDVDVGARARRALKTRRSSLLSCSGQENVAWSRHARPASHNRVRARCAFPLPRRRTHAMVPASRPAGQFGTIILACKKWRDNFGNTT